MTDQLRSRIIEENPIGKGLDTFRASFNTVCAERAIPRTLDALSKLDQEGITIQLRCSASSNQHTDIQNLALDLLSALRNLPAICFLPSKTGHGTLRNDVLRLISAAASDDFDLDRIKSLLKSAITNDDDALIWKEVYKTVIEPTPSPQPIASSL